MAVTKRLRFEIFRRDNHACRYCGAVAPDAVLTVDHVVPVALGGADEPANLVTACADCNSGKSATPPGAPLVADVAADALRWRNAMEVAADIAVVYYEDVERYRGEFFAVWDRYTYGQGQCKVPLPTDWRNSLDSFREMQLPPAVMLDAVSIAMGAQINTDHIFRYFCGVCWKKIRAMQDMAHEILAVDE